ncbi:hypothetical protein Lser_V15G34225 [Lactuca serriola]
MGGNEIQKIKNPALFPPAENPSSSLSKTRFLSFLSLDSQTSTASLLHIVLKVAAQVPDSGSCVTYIGEGGSGNFVKMVHNGIEYGISDFQSIRRVESVGKLLNEELHKVFSEWILGDLQSFLIEITASIFEIKDDKGDEYLVDKVLDKTGMEETGKWIVQQAADLSIVAPTITASLDS